MSSRATEALPHPTASREEVIHVQTSRLRALLEQIVETNAFYARKLRGTELPGKLGQLSDFSRRCPLTTKEEIVNDQLEHPPYGSNLTFPLLHYSRYHQTSGSTGTPLRWLDTPASWEQLLQLWQEIFQVAGINRQDRMMFAFTFGPFIGFWMAFEAATRLGCLCLPGGGLSSVARLKMILENRVSILCCTPTYAGRLAEVAAQEGIDLSDSPVRTILVAGEPGGSIPAVREHLCALWPGARIFDHHGMTEVGPITYSCPARPDILHVMESGYYAEILSQDSNRPVAPGDSGELVITTLKRAGMPLLRYRTGDLVKSSPDPNAPCACGRCELALHGGILGRVDDMIIVRGVNLYPSALDTVIRRHPEIVEYRADLTQIDELMEISLRIEPDLHCTELPSLTSRIQKDLQDTFSLRIPVEVVPHGTLPRFEMKAKRWLKPHPPTHGKDPT